MILFDKMGHHHPITHQIARGKSMRDVCRASRTHKAAAQDSALLEMKSVRLSNGFYVFKDFP